ncbi:hypothetical protein AS149_14905 [Burkholderia cenocepacia]|nr:hypothetical protein AS149_14905 [Burkholderia cenocepacia]
MPLFLQVAYLRERYIQQFGFPIVKEETLDALCSLLAKKRVLDAGSGTGFLSRELRTRNINVLAADNHSREYGFENVHHRDTEADAATLLPGEFDAVILSWPCLGSDFAFRGVAALRPDSMLVYQGERPGATAADLAFFKLTQDWPRQRDATDALNSGHLQFFGMKDRWTAMSKPTTQLHPGGKSTGLGPVPVTGTRKGVTLNHATVPHRGTRTSRHPCGGDVGG